jgi:hypothetical protein
MTVEKDTTRKSDDKLKICSTPTDGSGEVREATLMSRFGRGRVNLLDIIGNGLYSRKQSA